jgi:hypothetical protein
VCCVSGLSGCGRSVLRVLCEWVVLSVGSVSRRLSVLSVRSVLRVWSVLREWAECGLSERCVERVGEWAGVLCEWAAWEKCVERAEC